MWGVPILPCRPQPTNLTAHHNRTKFQKVRVPIHARNTTTTNNQQLSRLHHFADASKRLHRVVRAPFSNPPPTTTSSHQPSRCHTTRARRTSARPPFVHPMLPPLDKTDPSLQKVHKIRITLTSRKVSSLEKVCSELIERYVPSRPRAPRILD